MQKMRASCVAIRLAYIRKGSASPCVRKTPRQRAVRVSSKPGVGVANKDSLGHENRVCFASIDPVEYVMAN